MSSGKATSRLCAQRCVSLYCAPSGSKLTLICTDICLFSVHSPAHPTTIYGFFTHQHEVPLLDSATSSSCSLTAILPGMRRQPLPMVSTMTTLQYTLLCQRNFRWLRHLLISASVPLGQSLHPNCGLQDTVCQDVSQSTLRRQAARSSQTGLRARHGNHAELPFLHLHVVLPLSHRPLPSWCRPPTDSLSRTHCLHARTFCSALL